MLECNYALEPFDLRLALLRLLKRSGMIIAVTLAGILIFGGGYYLKNVVFGPQDTYGAESKYCVEYAKDPKTNDAYTYINAVTWNTWVHTDEFLEHILSNLDRQLDKEVLSGYLSADLPSDLRMPTSLVVTPDPELSVEIAKAVEEGFLDFAGRQREIESIRVVDRGDKAEKVLLDVRPLRACILSGVLTFFLTVIVLSIWEAGGDQIWLPATLRQRYGLKALGTTHTPGFYENLLYLFQGKKDVGIICVEQDAEALQVIQALSEADVEPQKAYNPKWTNVPSPVRNPESCKLLREMDGILLVVSAGSHVGKKLEYVLELLHIQDLTVTAALLWNADEALIRNYYRFSKERV